MKKQAELDFFISIVRSLHLPCNLITYPYENIPEFDLGIRSLLDPTQKFKGQFDFNFYSKTLEENAIYYAVDQFNCSYVFFKIPDSEPKAYLFIGPFLTSPFSTTQFYSTVEQYAIPAGLLKQIEHYYNHLTLIPDISILSNLLNVLGEKLWDGPDNFTLNILEPTDIPSMKFNTNFPFYQDDDMPPFSVKRIEERYEQEQQFIIAVSQGQVLKAEQYLPPYGFANLEPRTADSMRNHKNYSIILNTLLRKAAELGAVHPYHIDAMSSRFARRIEMLSTLKEVEQLHREMIHKYCLLVKNHSLKGYSLLVRKIFTYVDTDLTRDLSLNALASELNVNPSYLSTLFKKETGATLTEFVNGKRIDYALLLLNSTNMQIQTIAQHCGISDVNYFTKLFKKHIGKTPKEYRAALNPRK